MSDKLTHLLPCPFCGCTKVPKRQGNGIGDYWLECFDCGASTRLREDGAGMEKDWNRRPSPAPAITMPTLNDAMRAVLTNEHCVYGTPDELYAALVKAAPAISESENARKDAEAGFEAFANSYDHDSNEWLDMDAQQTFIHGWNAAIKAGQYVPESQDSSDDDQFFAGVCVALQVLTTHDQGVIWKDIVKACGVDDLLQYAANVEPEEWQLAGFAHFARRELGRRKPAARKGEKS